MAGNSWDTPLVVRPRGYLTSVRRDGNTFRSWTLLRLHAFYLFARWIW